MAPSRLLLANCCLLLAVVGWGAGVPMQGKEEPAQQEEGHEQAEKQAEGVEGQPKITYSKETVTKEGEEVKLDCAVEGVDLSGVNEFSVSWGKIDTVNPVNSMPISSGGRVLLFSDRYEVDHPAESQRYSLIIKAMTTDDEGLYRCTVDFGDSQRIHADVPVSLQAAPYFTDDFKKTLTVTEGDSISIDCQPGGSPRPDVYWERLNDELPYFGGRFFKSNQLDLPLVHKDHRGQYVCYADNGIGEPATSHVQLEVQYAPDLTLPANRVFTTTNEEVKLECLVSAYPSADVAWYKDEEAILGGANLRVLTEDVDEGHGVKSTLTVMDVNPDDLGMYSCRAANAVGKTEKSVQLTTKSPPIIVKQSRHEVLYDLEKARSRSALPLIIDCEADGAPTPNYRWTKDGEALVWQADPRLSLEEDTGSLIISQPSMEDNGLYQCFAYNDLGTAAADPVYLLNVTSIRFSNDDEASDTYHLVAELGRPYKLSCPKAFAYPEPSLTWVRAIQSPGSEDIGLEFVKDERVVSDPDGDLWFTHVTEDDDTDKHGFQFMCLANTPFEPYDYSIASIVNVAVKVPSDGADNLKEEMINVETFPMYTSGETVTFMAGEENTLWCIFGGEPVPDIAWRRADGEVMEPNTRITTRNYGRTLVFADTKLEDAGEYACVATNGVGPEKTSVMKVEVEQRPVLQEPLASQTVREGATVTFTCETNATGEVTYTWMLNGRRLSPRDRHLRRTIDGPQLVIAGASTTDVGNYACNATTTLGYAYGQAILNVLPSETHSSSCAGVEGLRAEMATLREAVAELRVLLTGQEDIAIQTHAALSALTEQLAATRTSTEKHDGEKKKEEEEEEQEDVISTTLSSA